MNKIKSQKGSSLLFTILIMSFIMAISFGVSYILLQEIKMTRDVGNSVVAFYAAETGIEKAMINQDSPSGLSGSLSPQISYSVIAMPPGANCFAQTYCLRSVGLYKETKRAIEIQY